ncbi:MAG: type II toxin-antitoxin system Phd/YefM family antitoxin [bacterium]|nr:type II toxin-antitoxin system Phd/YefM family antitoxin [bacterium]
MIGTVSITELKQNTAKVVKKIKTTGQSVVVIQRSEPAAVLVEPDYYEILEQALEDLDDLRVIRERKNESRIPYEQVAKELGLK